MLANGRERPTAFPDPGTPIISSGEGSNSAYKFAQSAPSFSGRRKPTDDEIEPLNDRDQEILQELEEFMTEGPNRQTAFPNNNNNTGFWPNKMAAANANGPSQQLSNTNGFQLAMGSSSSLQNKPGGSTMNLSSLHLNNQLLDQVNAHSSSIAQANPTSSTLKLLPGGANNPGLPPTNQFNQYSQQQDHLMRGFQGGSRASPHEIPTNSLSMRATEQYGSHQRSFPSTSGESQIRGLNRQTSSPFSQNYFPQDSHSSQSSNRTTNSKSDDRGASSSEHYQWTQSRFQSSSLCQPASGPSVSSQMQQPSIAQRRPPYMPVGQGQYPVQQQQQPQPNPFMLGSGMKPNPMHQAQQYYNSLQGMMGSSNQMGLGVRQSAMGNQVQKPQQDYAAAYQQQQQQSFQHRYSQPNYPPQLPPYMQSRQPPPSMGPSSMSRIPMQHHQPILPKPSVDIFGSQSSSSRYPSSLPDSPMDFPGPMMGDQQPPPLPPPPQLHRQQSYPSPGSVGPPSEGQGRQPVSQGQYQRSFPPFQSPLHSGSSSPNVTLGSPLRSLGEGFPGRTPPPSSGPVAPPTYPPTSNPPATNLPSNYPSESASHTGAAAAAAAALAAASSMTQFPGMGPQPLEQGVPGGYAGPPDGLAGSRSSIGMVSSPRSSIGMVPSPRSRTPTLPTPGLAGSEGRSPLNNVETDLNSINESQTTISPSQAQAVVPTPRADSPMSSFSGLSSPSSSFGNDQDEMDIPVDSITPTLTETSSSPFPDQSKPSFQYAKFSQLYEVDNNPERKVFLDKYLAFMESSGSPVTQVPVFNNQPLDLFKLYKIVREGGGLQEVVKRKAWDQVTSAMEVPPHLVYTLRTQYARFLLSFEMKYSSQGATADDILKNDLEDSGIPPPNAMVTCTEAIIPSATITTSQSGVSQAPGYNSQVNGSQSQLSYPGYKKGEGFTEAPSYANEGYANDNAESSRQPMPQLQNMGNYNVPPYAMGNERGSYPNYPNRNYPPYQNSQFTGAAALSQLAYQRNQPGMQGYPPQSVMPRRPSMMGPQQAPPHVMPSQSPQEQMPQMWQGSQYNASSEPGQMFDYLPSGQSSRGIRPPQQQYPPTPPYNPYHNRQQSQQYSPVPPQYRATASPHVPPSPSSASMQRPPPNPSQQPQPQHPPQQMSPKPKYTPAVQPHSGHHLKREISFPLDSVECTKPVFTKKRKLTSRDLGPVEAWRVMMSLKSGLLSETTWALDTLNILLYDESTVGYFVLSHLPGLLDNLLDHFRRYLVNIFGSFLDPEISRGTAFLHGGHLKTSKKDPSEEKTLEEKLEEDVCRSLTAFIASSSIDHPDEGFLSRSRMWGRGCSDTTTHIQTHIGTATSKIKQRRVADNQTKSDSELRCERKEVKVECKLEKEDAKKLTPEKVNALTVNVKLEEKQQKVNCDTKCSAEKGNGSVKLENCVTNSETREWDLDSDSDSDSSSETWRESSETTSDIHKNDSCLSKKESVTTRLKRELDLLIDASPDDEETNAYLESIIDTKWQQDKDVCVEEQESIRKEDAPLCLRTESDDAISRRCICVSNILRGLSFVPGNDMVMFKHAGLLFILGRLLLLYHEHARRVPFKRTYMHEEVEHDAPLDDRDDWWWHCLEVLRENALVILSNIAGHLDLTYYSDSIRDPILDGLLHWLVCESADAIDPMPTATAATSLSAQQLVLEALAKMSILGGNAELIISTLPSSRLEKVYSTLVRLLGSRGNPVTRELTLVLLSNLSQTDGDFASLGDKKQCISMLLQFIEDAANAINAYSSTGALAQAGFHSEDFCGTSVDMLRRAASTLACLARSKANRALFLPFQERILVLATLRLLDGMIGIQMADVLYYLSR